MYAHKCAHIWARLKETGKEMLGVWHSRVPPPCVSTPWIYIVDLPRISFISCFCNDLRLHT